MDRAHADEDQLLVQVPPVEGRRDAQVQHAAGEEHEVLHPEQREFDAVLHRDGGLDQCVTPGVPRNGAG